MRTYNADAQVVRPVIAAPAIQPIINKDTKLVSVEEASATLLRERGLKLSVKIIRQYCASGKWKRGVHWVKPSKSYLINLDAVYDWVACSSQ